MKKLANVITKPNTEGLLNHKYECEKIRREILYKKREIVELENKAQKGEDLTLTLQSLLEDFHSQKEILFSEDKTFSKQIKNMKFDECFKCLNYGVEWLLEKNARQSNRYELEMKRCCLNLDNEMQQMLKILKAEEDKLSELEAEYKRSEISYKKAKRSKEVVMRAIFTKQTRMERHTIQNMDRQHSVETSQAEFESQKVKYLKDLTKTRKEQIFIEKIKGDKKERQINKERLHDSLIQTKMQLDNDLDVITYEHGFVLADLERSKIDLRNLQNQANSLVMNMKSHQLLEQEMENKRLNNLLTAETNKRENELKMLQNKEEIYNKQIKEQDIENQNLGDMIAIEEEKLSNLGSRIPDFSQIKQQLHLAAEANQKNRNEVMRIQYFLDEIRMKNSFQERNEIEESKKRTQSHYSKLSNSLSIYNKYV